MKKRSLERFAGCWGRVVPQTANMTAKGGAKRTGRRERKTINTRLTFQSKNRAIRKEKRNSRIKPKETVKVPSQRLESRISRKKKSREIDRTMIGAVICDFIVMIHGSIEASYQ